MIGRLLGKVVALFVYLCVGTVIALVSGAVYLRGTGQLDDKKLERILAVAQGAEGDGALEKLTADGMPLDREQQSYDDRDNSRQLRARHLELREQAVQSALLELHTQRQEFGIEKDRYEELVNAFQKEVRQLQANAVESGRVNIGQLWQNIKPKQAKEQILAILEDGDINDVVTILNSIPIARRGKIIAEFKLPEELEKLNEVLKLMRQGDPEKNLAKQAEERLQQ